MCFTLHSHSIQTAYQHIANSRNSCLPTSVPTSPSSVAKKLKEESLHKIYTEKGEITGM